MPSVGHNSGAAQNEALRQKALFLKSKVRYKNALQRKKDADKAFKDECKRIIALDVTIDEIKYAIDLENDADGKMAVRMTRQLQIAAWQGHPIGTQFDLLEQPAHAPIIEKARDEGFDAGATDIAMTANPYAPGHDGYQAWIQGWHLGTEHAFNFDDHIKAPIVEGPKKRGRKPRLVVDNKSPGTEDDDMATPGGAEVDADGIPTAEAATPIEETPAAPETKAVDFDKLPVPPKPAVDPNAPIAGGGASFDEAAPTFLDRRRKKAAAPAAETPPPADVPPAPAADAEEYPDL